MATYCVICNSLIQFGSCTNKKCRNYKFTKDTPSTWKQEEYIRDLCRKLEINTAEYDFATMTLAEASRIIDELSKMA